MSKRGRPLGKLSETARLIFSRLGPEFRLKNQIQLRLFAKVGSEHLRLLRHNPERLKPHLLVRMADAVNVSAAEVLKSAGYDVTQEDDIAKLRNKTEAMNVSYLSAEDLQALVKLEKLMGGPLPTRYALQFLEKKRQNKIKT